MALKTKDFISLNIAVSCIIIGICHKFAWVLENIMTIGLCLAVSICLIRRKAIKKAWQENHIKFKILTKLLAFCSIFTKKDTYILIEDLFEQDAECIDAYSLFLWMQQHNIPSYYVIWRQSYFYKKLKQENKLKNIIVVDERFGTDFVEKAFFQLLKTKVIVSAFLNWGIWPGEEKKALVQKWISKNKQITHVYLNHGVTFLKKDVLNTYIPKYFDKLVVSSDIEKEIYQTKAGWQEQDIIKAGLTRWDLLKKEPHSQKTIFVFFTFRKTFHVCKDYTIFDYYKHIVSLFNNKKLKALLKKNNVKLVYGVHHAIYNQTNLDWHIDSENIEVADVQNISKYIKTADLFITDYSSIVFDFMFLNIPVIFYGLDFNDNKLLEIDKISMRDFDGCKPYIYNCIDDEKSLIEKIAHYINHNFELESENKAKNNQFYYSRQNISEKLYKEMEKL